jgi:hypothetical protein
MSWHLPSSFSLATDWTVRDGIPVGAKFSAPLQTGPGAYPASYSMGTGSFPGVKRPGRGVDHPLPSSAEVKERVELYLYTPSGPSWPVLGWALPLPRLFIRLPYYPDKDSNKAPRGYSWEALLPHTTCLSYCLSFTEFRVCYVCDTQQGCEYRQVFGVANHSGWKSTNTSSKN